MIALPYGKREKVGAVPEGSASTRHYLLAVAADVPSRWFFGGRYYAVTMFTDVHTRNGYGWELDDIGPSPGRGTVLEAFLGRHDGPVHLLVQRRDLALRAGEAVRQGSRAVRAAQRTSAVPATRTAA